jgi:hypothetical protein
VRVFARIRPHVRARDRCITHAPASVNWSDILIRQTPCAHRVGTCRLEFGKIVNALQMKQQFERCDTADESVLHSNLQLIIPTACSQSKSVCHAGTSSSISLTMMTQIKQMSRPIFLIKFECCASVHVRTFSSHNIYVSRYNVGAVARPSTQTCSKLVLYDRQCLSVRFGQGHV